MSGERKEEESRSGVRNKKDEEDDEDDDEDDSDGDSSIDSEEEEERKQKEEEEKARKAEIDAYKAEIEKLQLLNGDLSRRLKNALNMVESQKTVTSNAMRAAESYRVKYQKASLALNLEINKSQSFQKKKTKEEEYARYEKGRQKAEKMHEDLRMAVIDHKISNVRKEPVKLLKIRKKLDAAEKSQASQKQLLKYFSVQEKLTDDLASKAQEGDIDSCRDLIRKGAVVNEVDSAGYLPIHYACSSGFYDVVKLFLELGSDYSSYLTGFSPIVSAAKNGHAKIVEALVSFGCSVEDSGAAGTPALVAACSSNHLDVARILVDLGANVNSADIDGNSSLHVCARIEDPQAIIRFLLMKGADVKQINSQGVTPITVALNCLNVPALEALGGRESSAEELYFDENGEIRETGEGYEKMSILGLDNSASFAMPQESKVDAIPYKESSIVSQESM